MNTRWMLVGMLMAGLVAGARAEEPAAKPEAAPVAAAESPAADTPAGLKEMAPNRRELMRLLTQVMVARLSMDLGLNDEQTILMTRRLTEYREALQELRQQHVKLGRELREALEAKAEESVITERLNAVLAADEKMAAARRERFEAAAAALTPAQRAKLYVFVADFDNQLRRMVEQAKEERAKRAGLPVREEFRQRRRAAKEPVETAPAKQP